MTRETAIAAIRECARIDGDPRVKPGKAIAEWLDFAGYHGDTHILEAIETLGKADAAAAYAAAQAELRPPPNRLNRVRGSRRLH